MYMIQTRLEYISDFIDQHNDALRTATGQKKKDDKKSQLVKREEIIRMKDDLFIDKEKILVDGQQHVYAPLFFIFRKKRFITTVNM